jgi:hypothetical protein
MQKSSPNKRSGARCAGFEDGPSESTAQMWSRPTETSSHCRPSAPNAAAYDTCLRPSEASKRRTACLSRVLKYRAAEP